MRAVLAITAFLAVGTQPAGSAVPRDTTMAGTLHRVLAESFRVGAVRAVSRGALRVVVDEPLVKEPLYRAVLTRSCEAILESREDPKRGMDARALTTIEVVNRDERQGYVYRNLRGCAEVLEADQEGRRLAIVPGTTVFVPKRATKR